MAPTSARAPARAPQATSSIPSASHSDNGCVRIPDPGFAGDSGEPDPGLSAALAAYDAAPEDGPAYTRALTALVSARLLVPVVAVLGEVEVDEAGLAHDKSSDMAAVLLTGADGRLALLAFTGTGPMTAWNPEARPVPVTAPVAAQAALQEGAAALVVDAAGPVRFVVEGPALHHLATHR